MYNNSGYAKDTDLDEVRNDAPLAVNSCGHYRLVTLPTYSTVRRDGRRDYQLLYVAAGCASFSRLAEPSSGDESLLPDGYAYVYSPGEPQNYSYSLADQPDIFWLHYTGSEAAALTAQLSCDGSGGIPVGLYEDYARAFERIIRELQLKRSSYSRLCSVYAEELLLLMARSSQEAGDRADSRNRQIESVIAMMHEEIALNRTVEEYADICHMGACWFIRSFRAYAGVPPRQYLIRLKINKARELLSFSSHNISEIALLVGYENPLYFSRIFSRCMGLSPTEYREQARRRRNHEGTP